MYRGLLRWREARKEKEHVASNGVYCKSWQAGFAH